MRNDRYCCFAIPLYNIGIYAILVQFVVVGIFTGVVALAAPDVLAIVVATGLTTLMGVISISVATFALVGLYAVYREKANMFRKFSSTYIGLVALTFVYALVLIVISSTRHSQAVSDCLDSFLAHAAETADDGDKNLCNIWTWAQLGVCGLLWIMSFSSEVYFCIMMRRWASTQRSDHLQYRSIVSAARDSMALRPSQEWDSRSRSNSIDVRNGSDGRRRSESIPMSSSRLRHEVDSQNQTREGEILLSPQQQDEDRWKSATSPIASSSNRYGASPGIVSKASSYSSASTPATGSNDGRQRYDSGTESEVNLPAISRKH